MTDYYFDYNATTPLSEEAFMAMTGALRTHYGNPSSLHQMGQAAAQILKDARRKIAEFVDAADPSEIIFTSGATESNNAALRAALAANPGKKVIITSAVEHSSIRKLCGQLQKEGYEIREIGVDDQGRLKLADLEKTLDSNTAVATFMWANNETGVIFPIDEIGRILKKHSVLFHVDGVQAAGKIPIHLKQSAIDYLSLSAHKFYGPKGAGILYVKKGSPFTPLVAGGSQERGRRAGTENVPGIAGMSAACARLKPQLEAEMKRIQSLRSQFEEEIKKYIPDAVISGAETERLPNTSHLRIPGTDAETILISLDQKRIFASSGSACMSGSREPSHVLKAMGCGDEEASSALRFSFGEQTGEAGIYVLINELRDIVHRTRSAKTVLTAEKS